MKMPLPRDFQLEIRDKHETTLSIVSDDSAVDPTPHSRPKSASKEQVFANDGSPAFVHSMAAPSHKRQTTQRKYEWLPKFNLLRNRMAPTGLIPFHISSYPNKEAGDVDFNEKQSPKEAGEDGVDPKSYFTGPTPEPTGGDACTPPPPPPPKGIQDPGDCKERAIRSPKKNSVKANRSHNVAIYDYEGTHSVDGKKEFMRPEADCDCVNVWHDVDAVDGWDSVDPKEKCCSALHEDGNSPVPDIAPVHVPSDTLSDPVDNPSSAIDGPNEEGKDWEPHEAESILSDMFQDLGETCICLLEDGCICNLEECTCQDQDEIWRRLGLHVKEKSQASTHSPNICHECASPGQYSAMITRPDREKRLSKGSSADLHFLHSNKDSSDNLSGKKFGRPKNNKLSERVVCKRRLSPGRYETELDPAICGECLTEATLNAAYAVQSTNVDFVQTDHSKCWSDSRNDAVESRDRHHENETSIDMLYSEGTYSEEATENTNFLSVDSTPASSSSLAHAEDVANLSGCSTSYKTSGAPTVHTEVQDSVSAKLTCSAPTTDTNEETAVPPTQRCVIAGPFTKSMKENSEEEQSIAEEGAKLLNTMAAAESAQTTSVPENAAEGDVSSLSPPRKSHSDPDSAQSPNAATKTSPGRIIGDAARCPSSDPSLPGATQKNRCSRIPKRLVNKAGDKARPDHPEQQQEALGKAHTQGNDTGVLTSPVPPSEEGHAKMTATSGRSPLITEERKPPKLKVISTDNSPKPYLPQMITFYKHRDSKLATSIPPPLQMNLRKYEKPAELPAWNGSTCVEKSKVISRPLPLRSKRSSFHSLVSASSGTSRRSLSSAKDADSADIMSSSVLNDNAEYPDDKSSTTSLRPRLQKSYCSSQSREPFRPAGGSPDTTWKRKNIPPSNSARSHPDLRVPGRGVEVPVVYPSNQSQTPMPGEADGAGGVKKGTKRAGDNCSAGDCKKQPFLDEKDFISLPCVQESYLNENDSNSVSRDVNQSTKASFGLSADDRV